VTPGKLHPWLDAIKSELNRFGINEQFLRFAMVGTLGFCWDTATVYALRHLVNLYAAGTAGFLVAATANWLLNRLWTFRQHPHEAIYLQWAKFIAANAVGFVFNRGTFFALISISTICHRQPILAIAAGSCAGIFFNYFLSKRYVFR
jgi:putative flippase GtrA